MKRAAAIALLGVIAPMIQGALAGLLPPGWCPDASLLLVTALGLVWPGSLVGALALVALHGFVCDLLSGSLLGQHVLVSLCVFAAARIVSSHVNLHGVPSQMVLVRRLRGRRLRAQRLTAFFSPSAVPACWARARC